MINKIIIIWICSLGIISQALSQSNIPTPKSHFGFDMGENYHLTNYSQTESYFKKIAEVSDRIRLTNLGKTEEGRDQYMLIASAPENLKNLDRYQQISKEMALGNVVESEAKKLAKEGKAIVWIDGGMHATETVGTHQLIETIYQIASSTTDEVEDILKNVVILFVHVNPDGHELVGNWYMREKVPSKRSLRNLPTLYQKYVGHDNNRDFFMFNMQESRNLAKPLFIDWIPQIVYNHHQSAPSGTVVVGPPYRDPFNYVYDPILMTSLDAVGAAMNTRLNVEGKPGYAQRSASPYSTWWNGGLRTSVYFHNMIGILTEIIGSPNPSKIPLNLNRMLPKGDSPNPIHPQEWNFKKSIDYSVSLNMAVLNYASKNKEDLLYNIYKMGNNAIQKGNTAALSINPNQIDFLKSVEEKSQLKAYHDLKSDISRLDPTAYVISPLQSDFSNVINFLNRLIIAGVEVKQADKEFSLEGKSFPAGSYIVQTNQAFRAHVLDMFEPQYHPDDVAYVGGPPIPPYDAAGWTLAYTMGIEFDRIKSPIQDQKFTSLARGVLISQSSKIVDVSKNMYHKLTPAVNDNFKLLNLLLQSKAECFRDDDGVFYIKKSKAVEQILKAHDAKIGYQLIGVNKLPGSVKKIKALKIALWDVYGGSMKSGWTRWLLEEFGYGFDVVYNPDLDKGNLNAKYDIILFAGGGINAKLEDKNVEIDNTIPAEYHNSIGSFSKEFTLSAIKSFIQNGGKVITIGNAAYLASHLGIAQKIGPYKAVDNKLSKLTKSEFYIPGSIMTFDVNQAHPATKGLKEKVDVYFDESPVFSLENMANISPILTCTSKSALKSGWALGQEHLAGGILAYSTTIGKGNLYVFGPEIIFRAQGYSTFKLVFNLFY